MAYVTALLACVLVVEIGLVLLALAHPKFVDTVHATRCWELAIALNIIMGQIVTSV